MTRAQQFLVLFMILFAIPAVTLVGLDKYNAWADPVNTRSWFEMYLRHLWKVLLVDLIAALILTAFVDKIRARSKTKL